MREDRGWETRRIGNGKGTEKGGAEMGGLRKWEAGEIGWNYAMMLNILQKGLKGGIQEKGLEPGMEGMGSGSFGPPLSPHLLVYHNSILRLQGCEAT